MYKLQNIHENIMQTSAGRDGATAYRATPSPELPPPASSHSLRPSLREKTKEKFTVFANAAATACGCLLRSIFRFPFSLFLSNEKLLSIKYLLSRRILWHKSRLTVLLLAQNVACFSLCFPAIRWPSEISGA